MAYAETGLAMTLSAGVLLGIALGAASTFTVVAAFARLVPESHRSWALGLGTASGSLGQFLVAPLGQAFIVAYGWQTALVLMGVMVLAVPVLALALGTSGPVPAGEAARAATSVQADFDALGAVRRAFGHGSYVLLVLGFFTCGFQLAFVTVHLPPYLTDMGASPGLAAWAIALIGLCNVVGSYGAGVLGGRLPKRYILSFIYAGRAVAIAAFVLVPVTTPSVLAFAVVLGLLWLATVPPTSGLVAVMFGTRYIATLFGIVFLSHQVGSFIGVWLGAVLYERTGSYDIVWWIAAALSVVSALVHLPIREAPAEPMLAPAE
jgi:predicted MFS family arabinose efflux permease